MGLLGYPSPVRPLWLTYYMALPVFLHLQLQLDATPGGATLLGFDSPSRSISQLRPYPGKGNSLGVSFPFNARSSAWSRPTLVTQPRRPGSFQARILPPGPNPAATVSLTGFLNLSATFPCTSRPTIFRWVAFLGFSLQGFTPLPEPDQAHHLAPTLLTFLPLNQRKSRVAQGAHGHDLGIS
jgi:hypothetical protein